MGRVEAEPESLSKPYSSLPNRTVQAANGIDYAYRDTGHPPRTVEAFLHENRELFRYRPSRRQLTGAVRTRLASASDGRRREHQGFRTRRRTPWRRLGASSGTPS